MAKVTSKLQLTLPKAIAEKYKIRPGDDLDWMPAGDSIRVSKRARTARDETPTLKQRLQLFDEATARQEKRNARFRKKHALRGEPSDRGWTREGLYDRGLSR